MRKSCFLTVSPQTIIALCTDYRFLPDHNILSVKGKLSDKRNEGRGKAPDWSLPSICCLAMNHLLVAGKKKKKSSHNCVLCWLDKFSLVYGNHFGGVLFSPVLQNVCFASQVWMQCLKAFYEKWMIERYAWMMMSLCPCILQSASVKHNHLQWIYF